MVSLTSISFAGSPNGELGEVINWTVRELESKIPGQGKTLPPRFVVLSSLWAFKAITEDSIPQSIKRRAKFAKIAWFAICLALVLALGDGNNQAFLWTATKDYTRQTPTSVPTGRGITTAEMIRLRRERVFIQASFLELPCGCLSLLLSLDLCFQQKAWKKNWLKPL